MRHIEFSVSVGLSRPFLNRRVEAPGHAVTALENIYPIAGRTRLFADSQVPGFCCETALVDEIVRELKLR